MYAITVVIQSSFSAQPWAVVTARTLREAKQKASELNEQYEDFGVTVDVTIVKAKGVGWRYALIQGEYHFTKSVRLFHSRRRALKYVRDSLIDLDHNSRNSVMRVRSLAKALDKEDNSTMDWVDPNEEIQ